MLSAEQQDLWGSCLLRCAEAAVGAGADVMGCSKGCTRLASSVNVDVMQNRGGANCKVRIVNGRPEYECGININW